MYKIGVTLYENGLTGRRYLIGALKERDRSLGYDKYASRFDAIKQYGLIYDQILRSRDDEQPRGIEFRDMGQLIVSGMPPVEQIVENVLYAEQVHLCFGPSDVGKSIHAMWLSIQVMEQGGTVLYIDRENAMRQQVNRLIAMGVDPAMITRHFRYTNDLSATTDPKDIRQLNEAVEQVEPQLVICDSLISFLAASHLDESGANDTREWIDALLRPIVRNGPAAWILDHTGHDTNERPRGSSDKKGAVDVMFKFEKVEEFDRSIVGKVQLTRKKDREALLPDVHTLDMGSEDGMLMVRNHTVTDQGQGARPAGKNLIALDVLRQQDSPLGLREWGRLADMASSAVSRASKWLKEHGYVEKTADGKWIVVNVEDAPV